MPRKLPDGSAAASNFGPAAFQAAINVSRETLERLQTYQTILTKWNPRINLISRASMPELWSRHFLDSAQLSTFIPAGAKTLADFGSGGGFPGLVLAILRPELNVHLIDSDQRKAVFLREAARACGLTTRVHSARIEDVPPFPVDVISARALASLPKLLKLSARFARPGTRCLFPKGQDIEKELTGVAKYWNIRPELHKSKSHPGGRIVLIDWPADLARSITENPILADNLADNGSRRSGDLSKCKEVQG